MKKILFILVALVCAVTACTKEQLISDLPEDINKPEGGTTGATKANAAFAKVRTRWISDKSSSI